MQVRAHKRRLERVAVQSNETTRITFGPRRQNNVIHLVAILLRAKRQSIRVAQKIWQKEKFGNQFFYIRTRRRTKKNKKIELKKKKKRFQNVKKKK